MKMDGCFKLERPKRCSMIESVMEKLASNTPLR